MFEYENYISCPLYIRRLNRLLIKYNKVITGQRRIGKSYILLQISDIKNIRKQYHFVDKEQLAFTEWTIWILSICFNLAYHISCTKLNKRLKNSNYVCGVLLNEINDIYCTNINAAQFATNSRKIFI